MATLFILNDPPYGTERVYNGLRLATNLLRLDEGHELVVFLMGDAASAAKSRLGWTSLRCSRSTARDMGMYRLP